MNDRTGLLLMVAVLLAACIYFAWRMTVVNSAYPIFSWFVYGIELVGLLRTAMFLRSVIDVPRHADRAAPDGLHVDVAVTTFNEPIELVRPTLAAAVAIRYVHETWLLDDGSRSEMRALADELGCQYVSRTDRAHDKAGNLNNAIGQMHGAFLAIFDADHVADPRFLDRTLGYFDDAKLAFVQTPHEFRNLDSFDHLHRGSAMNAQSRFNYVMQPARNPSQSAEYCSSAGVTRRSALDAIGGFATGTVNEDTHTSLRFNVAGFHGIFHSEVLAIGLAPVDSAGFYGQRQRFAHGSMQILCNEPLLWRPGLTPTQRKVFIFHIISNLEGWRYLAIYLLPVIVLLTGAVPLATSGTTFLAFFIPYAALAWIATEIFSRGHARVFQTAVYNLARVPASIHAAFTGRRMGRVFRVTPKTHAPRRRPVEELFPWCVSIVSLAAIVDAVAHTIAGRPLLAPDALIIISIWAGYHAVTAIRLIALTQRCR